MTRICIDGADAYIFADSFLVKPVSLTFLEAGFSFTSLNSPGCPNHRYEGYLGGCTCTDFGLLGLDRFVIFRDGAFSDNYDTCVGSQLCNKSQCFISFHIRELLIIK